MADEMYGRNFHQKKEAYFTERSTKNRFAFKPCTDQSIPVHPNLRFCLAKIADG
jgi:hypothetical protein